MIDFDPNEFQGKNDNTEWKAMQEEFGKSSGGHGAFNDIPDYQTCDDETRSALDEIIDSIDVLDSEQMATYGDEVLEELKDVTDKIITAMMQEEHGVFREPMQECIDDLQSVNLETLKDQIGNVVQSGARMARKNKGATALAVTGLATGQFWLTLASGGYAASKEYLKKHGIEVSESLRQKKLIRSDQSDSIEAIEERLRGAITKSKEHIRKLEFANKQVPKVVERINKLAFANRDVYFGTTLFLGAGYEIARRIKDEYLPQAQQEFEQNSSFDGQMKIDQLTESSEVLDHKLQILEQARNESILSTQNLGEMKHAINQNRHSLKSLLTTEVPQWNRTLAVAGMALDTYRTTSVTEAFRNHLDRLTDDSVKASQHAMDAASKGQIGNPERLEKAIQRTIEFKQNLETRHQALENMSEKMAEKRQKLIDETNDLMKSQAEHAEREMNRKLEGPKSARMAALPDAATEQDNAPAQTGGGKWQKFADNAQGKVLKTGIKYRL